MINLNDLFAQLGLPSSDSEIALFIETRHHLASNVILSDASFWTPSQAEFLKEELAKDADWAEVIDQLNVRLHDC